jgi:AcrR family transcriptional regulator
MRASVESKADRCVEAESAACARREEILDVATRLFAEFGYSNADTQQLADRLQVGKGTIYRHFASKRELFLAAVDRGMSRLRERVCASMEGVDDPFDRIASGIEAFLTYYYEHPEIVELIIQERAYFKDRPKPTYIEHREKNVERWREFYRSLIAEGRVRAIPVERITDVISDLLYGTIFTNYFSGRRKLPAEQASDVIDIIRFGILSDSERIRRTPPPPPDTSREVQT